MAGLPPLHRLRLTVSGQPCVTQTDLTALLELVEADIEVRAVEKMGSRIKAMARQRVALKAVTGDPT